MEHFYSRQHIDENSFIITLYDNELTVLTQHKTNRSARPAVDGITIIYDDERPLIVHNTQTNEKVEINTYTISPNPGYEGSFVQWDFDGQWVFFTTYHVPVNTDWFSELWRRATGAYNVITGQSVFSEDFPRSFTGVPATFGDGKALFWQCGVAFGTDGTYSVIVDTANSNIRVVDVNSSANRISDNGRFLVSVHSHMEQELFAFAHNILTHINI